ncbi:hypothetical protein CapIbe_013420 [Capra ibex]
MKGCLLLPLLLLGTVSALYLEKDAPHLGDPETQADLSQDLEGSGGQEGELALSGEVPELEGEEAEDTHDDEGADPDDLDEDVQCPREEETVQLPGSPECKSCRYRIVRTPKRFKKAQRVCRKCYRGNLASIHNVKFNCYIQHLATGINQAQVWIGGFIRGWCLWRKYRWTDGSSWNFTYWALWQPKFGRGRCVALSTRGGRWRRAPCKRRLPFICSY